MQKTIVFIDGDEEQKRKFESECRKFAWIWRVKDQSRRKTSDEKKEYVRDTIERFMLDDSSYKEYTHGENHLLYSKFVLLIDSFDDTDFITETQEDYGAFSVVIYDGCFSNFALPYDYCFDTSTEDFTSKTFNVIDAFSK